MEASKRSEPHTFRVITPYNGPDFDEFCISEGRYLSARRDRSPCLSCSLNNLCQAGFEEQVKRVKRGENPSLTEGVTFSEEELSKEHLLNGLTTEQVKFIQSKIPTL
jgi:hypothetical protein